MSQPFDLHPFQRQRYEQYPDEVVTSGASVRHPETDAVLLPALRLTGADWLADLAGCLAKVKEHRAASEALWKQFRDPVFHCWPVPAHMR